MGSNLRTKEDTKNLDYSILEVIRKRTAANNPIGVAEIHREIGEVVSKKSVFYRIQKMIQNKQIKNTVEKPKDPRYVLDVETDFDIKVNALTFKTHQGMFSLHGGMSNHEREQFTKNSQKAKVIQELIFNLGLNQLFTILESYQQKNKKNQELWLRNASAYENTPKGSRPSELVNKKLLRNFISKQSTVNKSLIVDSIKTENPSDYTIRDPRYSDYQKYANELSNELAKMFPDAMMERQDNERFQEDDNIMKLIKKVGGNNPQFLLD